MLQSAVQLQWRKSGGGGGSQFFFLFCEKPRLKKHRTQQANDNQI